ncbi:WecB/TagA/CpsF family glycosyltransferase [Geobacillus stearothermophilus]|jgi:N-acetylglucosaminyldiphosphoundecaprenol N-acetyl-beta-D-mannosaminyltransferase|uniref:WecB/TagA/CpsF family glycosyltransferase n=2 Tax=Geobacillus stearothermophilus TaxID=1422 RepID=UPI002E2149E2|nr:WecB/TagA/CpsF family glycosyltransferase [Geobacillus stearothermophilus]MED4987077.1 WecB/TagA/CpsF family glycosyltransferase [Geobacillus stearothermophilus]
MNIEYFGNVKLTVTTKKEALTIIEKRIKQKQKTQIFFLNAHCFNVAQKDTLYRNILNKADLVLNDGIGVEIGSKLFKIKLKENMNGTDFTPEVLKFARDKNLRVFLFGSYPGVAEKAAEKLKKQIPNLKIVGYLHGYFDNLNSVIELINKSNSDLLIVALGVPLQEKWIASNLDKLNVKVAIGVGAFLDFASQRVKRAPLWVRKIKMEWVYRLMLEPKRLWKRYLIGNVVFFYHIFKFYRLKRRTEKYYTKQNNTFFKQ